MGISTHILDTANGRPATGVSVTLERQHLDTGWTQAAHAFTNEDGRVAPLLADDALEAGTWRITFATGAWYAARGEECFHPDATIAFTVRDPDAHYHVPLLVTPWSYSTYRGS